MQLVRDFVSEHVIPNAAGAPDAADVRPVAGGIAIRLARMLARTDAKRSLLRPAPGVVEVVRHHVKAAAEEHAWLAADVPIPAIQFVKIHVVVCVTQLARSDAVAVEDVRPDVPRTAKQLAAGIVPPRVEFGVRAAASKRVILRVPEVVSQIVQGIVVRDVPDVQDAADALQVAKIHVPHVHHVTDVVVHVPEIVVVRAAVATADAEHNVNLPVRQHVLQHV